MLGHAKMGRQALQRNAKISIKQAKGIEKAKSGA